MATLQVETVGRVMVTSRKISPATYIGAGKAEEVKNALAALDATAAIFDFELTPNQLRNLEKAVGQAVLDRSGVIIEIFTRHARTKESKTQVELARLQYLLPRLTHLWSHFERQRGGGATSRGMGEKQIEVDRRLVKKRMSVLRDRLAEIERERVVQRAGRKDVLKVALVGYTNAGKSTLLNALTEGDVLVEDKLFATLDPTSRRLRFPSEREIIITDTVGFIRDLPKDLVAAFRATLEELEEADLLLHVVDAADPAREAQIRAVERILEELKLNEKPRLIVFNKCDRLTPEQAIELAAEREQSIAVSAKDVRTTKPLLVAMERVLWREDRLKDEPQLVDDATS